jgi:ABC-type transport system substrate-binding protein
LIQTPAQSLDREWQARWSALRFFARGSGDAIWTTFDGRLHSTPQNRFGGTNANTYANPALDRLIDRLYSTLDRNEQGRLMGEMGEILAADLPALPLYLRTTMSAVNNRVDALADYEWTTFEPGSMSRSAYLWDRR